MLALDAVWRRRMSESLSRNTVFSAKRHIVALVQEDDVLPPEGEMANMLAWISNDPVGHSFFPVVLDGPAWVGSVGRGVRANV